MADVIGMSDVSTPDTGKGNQLKTGGINRRHNMPNKEKCKTNWKKIAKGMSRAKAHKSCYPGQKAGTSSKKEQDRAETDIGKAQNARMKKRLKKNY